MDKLKTLSKAILNTLNYEGYRVDDNTYEFYKGDPSLNLGFNLFRKKENSISISFKNETPPSDAILVFSKLLSLDPNLLLIEDHFIDESGNIFFGEEADYQNELYKMKLYRDSGMTEEEYDILEYQRDPNKSNYH